MPDPISIRIDDEDRPILQFAAEQAGVGLATLVRRILHQRARELRIEQVRAQSRAVGKRLESDAAARELYDDVGTPHARV